MKQLCILRSFAIIGLVFVLLNAAQARRIEKWSYDRLLKTADVVMIATVVDTGEWSEPMLLPLFADALEGRLTRFKVEVVLKGKLDGDKIELIHCRLKDGRPVLNGPLLAEFRTTGRKLLIEAVDGVKEKRIEQEATPQYLLFLKARPDGRYEPVAGQVDSILSVRQVGSAK